MTKRPPRRHGSTRCGQQALGRRPWHSGLAGRRRPRGVQAAVAGCCSLNGHSRVQAVKRPVGRRTTSGSCSHRPVAQPRLTCHWAATARESDLNPAALATRMAWPERTAVRHELWPMEVVRHLPCLAAADGVVAGRCRHVKLGWRAERGWRVLQQLEQPGEVQAVDGQHAPRHRAMAAQAPDQVAAQRLVLRCGTHPSRARVSCHQKPDQRAAAGRAGAQAGRLGHARRGAAWCGARVGPAAKAAARTSTAAAAAAMLRPSARHTKTSGCGCPLASLCRGIWT